MEEKKSYNLCADHEDDDKIQKKEEAGEEGRLLATYAPGSCCRRKSELMTDAQDSPLSGRFLRRCEQCFV